MLLKSIVFFLFLFASFAEAEDALRVVSLSPCLTELVFHLGKGNLLVGRTSACDYPEDAKKVEVVGGFGKPSLEKLLTLKPDVVIASALADPALVSSIKRFGIDFHLLPTKSIEDYYVSVATLGKILHCEKKAFAEIARVGKGLRRFAKLNAEKGFKRPSVYLEIWDRPYMTVGKKSFINDLITYAGGENIAGKLNQAYFNCSVELIITSDPEVIICPAMKTGREADVESRRGWKRISAVREHRVYVDLNDDLIYRLGPRILEGVELLRSLIMNKTAATPSPSVDVENPTAVPSAMFRHCSNGFQYGRETFSSKVYLGIHRSLQDICSLRISDGC
ncbi:MAG: cobalamin-binding protein [Kiritimatiellaeota bacterium]|nr:cobalamin-binding protein [Kiritimatiellota bacterium]